MDPDTFAVTGIAEPLTRVSPALGRLRLALALPPVLLGAGAAAVAAIALDPRWWAAAGAATLLAAWLAWLLPAQVRRMGWAEAPEELLLARGRLWRTVTVVPYGRIQFVDVTAGPLQRALGIAELTVHTASATSDSRLRGIPAAQAHPLRERLTGRARERLSGL
ncbi:PH domain-containing protein [Corynebacterium sphenisci]|uniref:PH domain-containing protein n=1 Tax=Corynebacterium sphenisci TaxID=191493 RepID=UPI000952A384|nr:PH domain-containing protein [Corynebacterium sphenisci]